MWLRYPVKFRLVLLLVAVFALLRISWTSKTHVKGKATRNEANVAPNFSEFPIRKSYLGHSKIYVEVLDERKAPMITAENLVQKDRQIKKQHEKSAACTTVRTDAGNSSNDNVKGLENPSRQNEYLFSPKFSELPDLVQREDNLRSNTAAPQKQRANVLIVAAKRTGSSFLGELFQQRHDFFYMFEPGMLLMHKLDSLNLTHTVMVTNLIKMINSFFKCKFNGMKFFVDTLNQGSPLNRKRFVPAIVSRQFCKNTCFNKCESVTERLLETACTTRAHTAIKTIRILDINLMLSAVRDVNLKLIHLVRDPRSMAVSQLRIKYPEVEIFNNSHLTSNLYQNVIIKYCYNWIQNFEVGHYTPFLAKNNYLMVRYEDIALNPYAMAGQIYNFVGVGGEIPTTVQTWLKDNTNSDDTSKKSTYSTKRDSQAVLVGWKKRVTLDFVHTIENMDDCKQLMKVTGYRLVGSEAELLKSLDDNMVDPLPKLMVQTIAQNLQFFYRDNN